MLRKCCVNDSGAPASALALTSRQHRALGATSSATRRNAESRPRTSAAVATVRSSESRLSTSRTHRIPFDLGQVRIPFECSLVPLDTPEHYITPLGAVRQVDEFRIETSAEIGEVGEVRSSSAAGRACVRGSLV
jgi:hypothetical protein